MSAQAQGECPKCNAVNPRTTLVCWTCGAKLPWADEAAAHRHEQGLRTGAQTRELHGTPATSANRPVNLIAVLLWFLVVGACGYFLLQDPQTVGETVPSDFGPSSVATPVAITISDFEKIKDGMTYKECVDAIGRPGTQSEFTYDNKTRVTTMVYIWQNSDGSNCMAEFENGRLTTKAQAGLKAASEQMTTEQNAL